MMNLNNTTVSEIILCIKQLSIELNMSVNDIANILNESDDYKGILNEYPSIHTKRIYLSNGSWLDFFPMKKNIISFADIWSIKPKERGKVKIYGKMIDVPRFQKSYGKDYTFSGIIHKSDPIPNNMFTLLEWINSLGYGIFNQILIN